MHSDRSTVLFVLVLTIVVHAADVCILIAAIEQNMGYIIYHIYY